MQQVIGLNGVLEYSMLKENTIFSCWDLVF